MEVLMNVNLTKDDLFIILSALNEICNGIDIFEFETRIGASKVEVQLLEERIKTMLNQLENGDAQ
jgi:hypothetical protein